MGTTIDPYAGLTRFDYGRAMPTPWGKADSKTKVADGVYEVSTPGHGGIMVGKAVAARSLSAAALRIGDPFGSFLAFEEDVAYAAVYADRPDWYRAACEAGATDDYRAAQAAAERGEFHPTRVATDEQIRAFFLEIAQHWFPAAYQVPTPAGVGWMTLPREGANNG